MSHPARPSGSAGTVATIATITADDALDAIVLGDLTDDERAQIVGLIRADIQKRERSLENFRPFPGQSPDDAAAGREKIVARLERMRTMLEKLTGSRQ